MKRNKVKVALFLSTLLVTSSFSVVATPLNQHVVAAKSDVVSPSEKAQDQKVIARVSKERIFEDALYLTETIGPRVTGTEGEQQAADFIRARLSSYGYTVETQEFSIPDKGVGYLKTIDDKEVLVTIPAGSGETSTNGLTAELYDAGMGYPENFSSEASNKIALISRGGNSFTEKVQNAIQAGVSGVLIYNNIDALTPLNPSLGNSNFDIPVGGITKVSGEALRNDIVSHNKTVNFKVQLLKNAKSQNIIATRTPQKGSNHEIVYVSAHYDSVPFSPGASDNASGTAVALELARVLKSYPIDKELRFVFVGAEEIGLVGSKYYASQLSRNELSRSLANFNMDMVGTAWENATAIYMNTIDGMANIATNTALATAKRIGTPSELILFKRGASDHQAFYDVGIPAVNFIRREPGTASLEPYYHTPLDTMEYLSADRMKEAADLVGASIYSLIRK